MDFWTITSVLPSVNDFVCALFGLDDVVVGMLVATVVSSVVAAGTSAYNSHKQEQMNNELLDREDDKIQMTKELQEKQWAREDTALQRKVSDARAAGLSPLAALGATGSPSTPINYTGSAGQVQAPQMDLSNTLGLLSSLATDATSMRNTDVNANTQSEATRAHTAEVKAQIDSQEKMAKLSANTSLKVADTQQKTAIIEVNAGIDKANQQTKYLYDLMTSDEEKNNVSQIMDVSKQVNDYRLQLASSVGFNAKVEYFDDWSEYEQFQKEQSENWLNAQQEMIDYFNSLKPEEQANYYTWSKNSGKNKSLTGAFGLDRGKSNSSSQSDSLGSQGKNKPSWSQSIMDSVMSKIGFNVSGGYTSGESNGESYGTDTSMQQLRQASSFYLKNKCAIGVYVGKYRGNSKPQTISHY